MATGFGGVNLGGIAAVSNAAQQRTQYKNQVEGLMELYGVGSPKEAIAKQNAFEMSNQLIQQTANMSADNANKIFASFNESLGQHGISLNKSPEKAYVLTYQDQNGKIITQAFDKSAQPIGAERRGLDPTASSKISAGAGARKEALKAKQEQLIHSMDNYTKLVKSHVDADPNFKATDLNKILSFSPTGEPQFPELYQAYHETRQLNMVVDHLASAGQAPPKVMSRASIAKLPEVTSGKMSVEEAVNHFAKVNSNILVSDMLSPGTQALIDTYSSPGQIKEATPADASKALNQPAKKFPALRTKGVPKGETKATPSVAPAIGGVFGGRGVREKIPKPSNALIAGGGPGLSADSLQPVGLISDAELQETGTKSVLVESAGLEKVAEASAQTKMKPKPGLGTSQEKHDKAITAYTKDMTNLLNTYDRRGQFVSWKTNNEGAAIERLVKQHRKQLKPGQYDKIIKLLKTGVHSINIDLLL